jgi:hypothetical protein
MRKDWPSKANSVKWVVVKITVPFWFFWGSPSMAQGSPGPKRYHRVCGSISCTSPVLYRIVRVMGWLNWCFSPNWKAVRQKLWWANFHCAAGHRVGSPRTAGAVFKADVFGNQIGKLIDAQARLVLPLPALCPKLVIVFGQVGLETGWIHDHGTAIPC